MESWSGKIERPGSAGIMAWVALAGRENYCPPGGFVQPSDREGCPPWSADPFPEHAAPYPGNPDFRVRGRKRPAVTPARSSRRNRGRSTGAGQPSLRLEGIRGFVKS